MWDLVMDAFIDTVKLLPFLFITFLIIELLEHKYSKKLEQITSKSGKIGPVLGSFLGIFPQCGFSVAMTNLYACRIITLGTLIAVYLSTSDEMIPVLLSSGTKLSFIILVIVLKVFIGMFYGLIIDLFNKNKKIAIENICTEEICHCEEGILKSAIHHTINIGLFIFITTLLLNTGISYLGTDKISKLLLKNSLFSPFISSLIGLIPNCASSVLLTQLYLENLLSFPAVCAGLLVNSGIGMLVLFRVNPNTKDNLKIVGYVTAVSLITGCILNLFL